MSWKSRQQGHKLVSGLVWGLSQKEEAGKVWRQLDQESRFRVWEETMKDADQSSRPKGAQKLDQIS